MQDRHTGEVHPISDDTARIWDEMRAKAEATGAKGADPPPVFKTGEILEIRGARFRIVSIGRKEMRLRGMAGVKPRQ